MNFIDTVRLPFSAGAAAMALPFAGGAQECAHAGMDLVFIENFRGQTVIGIDDDEQHTPQPVTMHLAIGLASLPACVTDRIEDTINYAAVREALHALLASHRVKLLEALAEQVAQRLIEDFGAHWVRVQVAKPARFDDVAAVGVVIERRRESMPRAPYARYASLGEGLVPA